MRSRIKKKLQRVFEKVLFRKSVTFETEFFGSEYGGWEAIPSLLNADSTVYSLGIGEDASFDTALIERFAVKVDAFDPTPRSIAWVKQQGFPSGFVLHEFGVADFDGEVEFHPPQNPQHVSHSIIDSGGGSRGKVISVPVKRLLTIIAMLGHQTVDLLKMDIEGAEYKVVEDLLNSDVRPRQILIEFHHRFAKGGLMRTFKAVRELRRNGYEVFWVSKSHQEFGFVRSGAEKQNIQ